MRIKNEIKNLKNSIKNVEWENQCLNGLIGNISNPVPPNTFSCLWDFQNKSYSNCRNPEVFGIKECNKEDISSLVIEEQKVLIEYDIITIWFYLKRYLNRSFWYSSIRAMNISGDLFLVSVVASHVLIDGKYPKSHLLNYSIIANYNGEPYQSSIGFSPLNNMSKDEKLDASGRFLERKHQLFTQFETNEKYREIMILINQPKIKSKEKLITTLSNRYPGKSLKQIKTLIQSATRTRNLESKFEEYFPILEEYMRTNQDRIRAVGKIFSLA